MYLRHTTRRKDGKVHKYWRLVRSVRVGRKVVPQTVGQLGELEAVEARYGLAQRIWVMDRGMTSADNLEWLRETGRRYLVGTPKSELRKWAGALADARDWHTVRDGVEAKQCVGPDGVETFVLIRSVAEVGLVRGGCGVKR